MLWVFISCICAKMFCTSVYSEDPSPPHLPRTTNALSSTSQKQVFILLRKKRGKGAMWQKLTEMKFKSQEARYTTMEILYYRPYNYVA